MLCALRGKFTLEPYHSALLLTHPHPLAEDSPSDYLWGARDPDGGHGGKNQLGLALDARPRRADRRRAHPPDRALARPLNLRRAAEAHGSS